MLRDELAVGDRLRYTVGKGRGAVQIIGRIDGIERPDGSPHLALFTREDGTGQLVLRLGDLARHSTRLGDLPRKVAYEDVISRTEPGRGDSTISRTTYRKIEA